MLPFENITNAEFYELLDSTPVADNNEYFDPSCIVDSYSRDLDPDSCLDPVLPLNCSDYYDLTDWPSILNSVGPTIKIISQNIRSLGKNLDEFMHDISPINFDVCALSETWVTDDTECLYRSLAGYSGIFNNRASRGGGVGLYISSKLFWNHLPNISIINNYIETLFVHLPDFNTIVGCIYRPPAGSIRDFNEKLDELLAYCRSNFENCSINLCGDFNLNLFRYDSNLGIENYLNVMFAYNLYPVARKATRVTQFARTLVDNIWTSDLRIKRSGIIRSNITDHYPVFIAFCMENHRINVNT